MTAERVPGRLALISDIHANAEALSAVFADIDRRGIQDVWCLGDIVGYGPDPVWCVLAVRDRCSLALMGNHDFAAVYTPMDFNPVAEQAIRCHAKMMRERCHNVAGNSACIEYLAGLPRSRKFGDVLFVHSSPRDPTFEYLFIDRAYNRPEILDGVFDFIDRCCFCGHTHFPGIVTRSGDGRYLGVAAKGDEAHADIPGDSKSYVNVGSVGQPRDGDRRSCYVELFGDRAVFHRVEYDFRVTMGKLATLACIDPRCGTRLAEGR